MGRKTNRDQTPSFYAGFTPVPTYYTTDFRLVQLYSKREEPAMFRTQLLISAISFPLLCAGCGEDTAPPSGLETEAPLQPSERASATAFDRLRFQLRRTGVDAVFSQIDPSACVETFVSLFGAERALKEGPGKPATGPLAVVFVSEVDFCTEQILREIFGVTSNVVLQADPKLTEASLRATITAVDNVSGAEVLVEVDLAWTGTGELVSRSDRSRVKMSSLLQSTWFKGTFRDAVASGTVVVDGENLGTDASIGADIFRARSGLLEMRRTSPEPPDTLS